MIRLNCFFTLADEEKKKAFVSLAQELVEKSRTDAGCIAYDILFSCTNPLTGMICETWQNAEVLAAHEKSAHFAKYVGIIQELAEMKLEKFEF